MLEELKEILADFMDIDGLDITPETLLSSEIGLSSLDYFAFIGDVQDRFGVTISDKELMKLRSVGDLISCIQAKRA